MTTLENATYLFKLPHDCFHSSESYWSSLFAIQVLDASRQGVALNIPIYNYCEEGERWWFEEKDEKLTIPSNLDFEHVVVEGTLRTGFIKEISAELPHEFSNLRPDIIILGNSVSIIEAKTVGAHISEKEYLYIRLCNWLRKNGCAVEAYLLLSAGHQPDKEVSLLADKEWLGPRKLILWESFFKAVERQVEASLISRMIPDIATIDKKQSYLGKCD